MILKSHRYNDTSISTTPGMPRVARYEGTCVSQTTYADFEHFLTSFGCAHSLIKRTTPKTSQVINAVLSNENPFGKLNNCDDESFDKQLVSNIHLCRVFITTRFGYYFLQLLFILLLITGFIIVTIVFI